jgi:tRNA (guanine10-N2)-dimethyltransferase
MVSMSQTKFPYIAILGRQPELGLMELESILGAEGVQPLGGAALISSGLDVNRLGGAVKIGAVAYDGPVTRLDALPIELTSLPVADGGKTPFALSVYGGRATRAAVEAAGLTLKKSLRERGSVRLITPKEGTAVTAAQLSANHVLRSGFELLVVIDGKRMILALTIGVQDIDWYNRRDYGRPARSAKVGMLPPKLAQVMVNTTKASTVYDPFCGTGVVLQEALLMGRLAVGSDLSPEMVEASRRNLDWLTGEAAQVLMPWSVGEADARSVRLPDVELAVVSEGYLGPNLSAAPSPAQLKAIKAEMADLYRAVLQNLARQLDSGAEVTICVPAWRMPKGWSYLEIVDDLRRLGYTNKVLKHVPQPVLYARLGQMVGRQILLLRKR